MGGFYKVEVATHNEVHVVGDGAQVFELASAACVVVLSRSEVEVESPEWLWGLGCGSIDPCERDALGLACQGGVEGVDVGVIARTGGGRDHNECAPPVIWWVVVYDLPAREFGLQRVVHACGVEARLLNEDDVCSGGEVCDVNEHAALPGPTCFGGGIG